MYEKICFYFFWVCLVDWLDDMESGSFIYFFKKLPNYFSRWLCYFVLYFFQLYSGIIGTQKLHRLYTIWGVSIYVYTLTNVYYYHPGNKYVSLFKTFLVSLFSGEGVFVIRAQHELYPLNRILSTQCIINYNHFVVQLISSTYSSCETNFIPIKQLPNPPSFFPW